MISTFHRTISGAWSSFTSSKEPKFLKRPPSYTLSQPNDPAISPPTAHMPRSRSSTSSNTDKKSQKGCKAVEFLSKHFNATEEENDPIENSSPPPRAIVRRIKPTLYATAGKIQEALPNPLRSKREASEPELNHQRLLVDADERSLFPGNAPPVSDAVYIAPPSLATSDRNSSVATTRSRPFRPPNTLDSPKSSAAFNGSRRNIQESHSKQSGCSSYTKPMLALKSDYSTRKGTGEPPSKRQRTSCSSMPYMRNGGAGLLSPNFGPATNEDCSPTSYPSSKTPVTKQSGKRKSATSSPLVVNEYQSVEETMQSSPSKKNAQTEVSPHFISKLLKGHRQRSEESDPEKFTRDSKRARYQQTASEPCGHLPNSDQSVSDSHGRQNGKTTPPAIRDIFRTSILPSDKGSSSVKARELSDDSSTAGFGSKRRHSNSTQSVWKGSDSFLTERQSHQWPAKVKTAAGNKSKDRPGNPKIKESKFPLHYLNYGFSPDHGNYVASISEGLLQISYPEPTLLSDEPLWAPVQLSKILKIYHGSQDCLKLMLEMSQCQGQPSNKMHLEFCSKEDKDTFLLLMPKDVPKTLRVQKEDEYIRKCFERDADVPVKSASQVQPLANVKHQPISNPRHFTSTTSAHFQNQQTFLSNNASRPPKLIKQLQSSSSASSNPTAMSASPTIITGKDRANESAAKLAEQITTAGTKTTISEQAGSPSASRLRSSSGKVATRSSSLRGKMSIDESEDGVQRRKYSETHGFGEPWRNPLIYPKTGKRRMAVEFGDLYRLDEDEFLNDNLIGFFLRYLEYHLEQTNQEVAKKVYFYNSYFFERLMQTSKAKKGINYDSVQKWTRNVDIFGRDFIVVPVNESFHWYVVIICNLSKINTVNDDDDDGNQDIQSGKSPLVKLVITGREGDYEVRKGNSTEEGHDQPTEKTTESLSHLSLSDYGKQVDELAPSINALSFLSSSGANPRKSGPGRRKATRHSLPKYNVSAPVIMTFDSLGAARSSTCTALRQYIVEEAKNKKGWDIDGSLIKGMTAKGIPTQTNFSDCGLYLCAYMEKFILDPAMFVGKILQREMDPSRDIPLMASEELRSRMRGMIIELHHEQEGEEPEFPIPKVGRILLAPLRAVSSNNVSASRTPLQDDSEDELQQDHTKLDIVKTARSPSATARVVASEHDHTSLTSAPLCRESTPSETANTMTEILAKINGNAESHPKSDSGTRETAITIDDDEDPQPVFQRGSAKSFVIAEDDFFEHPAKLKGTATASNTSTSHLKTESAFPDAQSPHRRSQSRASAETVTTDYLSGSANRSYRHDEQDTEHDTGAKAGHVQEKVVLMVPDSQQSQEMGEEENADIEGMAAENEPEEILEGIE